MPTLEDPPRRLPSVDAVVLVSLALVNFFLKYLTTIVLANTLAIEDFEHYAVAIASVLFCSTLVELGLGKQGIRLVPQFIASDQPRLAAGYWRFTMRAVLLFAVLLGVLISLQEALLPNLRSLASDEAMYLLPVIALTGVGAELVLACGAAIVATVVVRLVVPGVFLGFAVWAARAPAVAETLTPHAVILVYGAGWLLGLILLLLAFAIVCPKPALRGPAEYEPRVWLRGGLGFLGVAIAISALLEGTVALAEFAAVPSGDIAIYAVCIETGAFVLILVKSLDKFYLQRISALITQGDLLEIHRIRRRRAGMMLVVCVGFCVAIFIWGRPLLARFGADFERGYYALCVVTVATSAWTLTSLSQWLIAFTDGPAPALRITLGGVLAAYTGILLLGPMPGPTGGLMGVALSYGVMVTLMAGLLEFRARTILARMASEADQKPEV